MSYKSAVQGWIYCLMNYRDRTNVKIGMTLDIEDRLRAANGSFHIDGFYIVIAKWVNNPYEREQTIHRLLKNKRVNPKREFFDVTDPDSLKDILDIFSLIDGHEHPKSRKNFNYRNPLRNDQRTEKITENDSCDSTDQPPTKRQCTEEKRGSYSFDDFEFEGF